MLKHLGYGYRITHEENMANSKFNETEKDYMFFVYGTNFEYRN